MAHFEGSECVFKGRPFSHVERHKYASSDLPR